MMLLIHPYLQLICGDRGDKINVPVELFKLRIPPDAACYEEEKDEASR
jgi:hypothetical protein